LGERPEKLLRRRQSERDCPHGGVRDGLLPAKADGL